uniref:Chitin-binding type-2 domain-containing protein n=1 Tax=Magallana gigas TaxID=29159 RepID=K1RCZ1_MAGGI
MIKLSCPPGTVWDDREKGCTWHTSTTCPPPKTTPKTNRFLRMKRSVEMNAESTRLTNIALETNTKRWVLLGTSFIGGVMIVASLLVIIKLRRQSGVVYHSGSLRKLIVTDGRTKHGNNNIPELYLESADAALENYNQSNVKKNWIFTATNR